MKFGWAVSEALTELLGIRSKSNKKAIRARVQKVPPKIPPNILDSVGVRWRSIELVYTKKP